MRQDEKASGATYLHLQFTLWYLLSTEKTLLDPFDLPPFLMNGNQRNVIIRSGSDPRRGEKNIHCNYNLHKLVLATLNLQGIWQNPIPIITKPCTGKKGRQRITRDTELRHVHDYTCSQQSACPFERKTGRTQQHTERQDESLRVQNVSRKGDTEQPHTVI